MAWLGLAFSEQDNFIKMQGQLLNFHSYHVQMFPHAPSVFFGKGYDIDKCMALSVSLSQVFSLIFLLFAGSKQLTNCVSWDTDVSTCEHGVYMSLLMKGFQHPLSLKGL